MKAVDGSTAAAARWFINPGKALPRVVICLLASTLILRSSKWAACVIAFRNEEGNMAVGGLCMASTKVSPAALRILGILDATFWTWYDFMGVAAP